MRGISTILLEFRTCRPKVMHDLRRYDWSQ
jgi:hypothetical protein